MVEEGVAEEVVLEGDGCEGEGKVGMSILCSEMSFVRKKCPIWLLTLRVP